MSTVCVFLAVWVCRTDNNAGKLQDVQVEHPARDDEEQELPSPVDLKGKRKAPPT